MTSKGVNTSAIFGFVNTLEEVLRKENPTHIAVAFDPAGPTFRHTQFESYKAQREATPEDIKTAIPVIKKFWRPIAFQSSKWKDTKPRRDRDNCKTSGQK